MTTRTILAAAAALAAALTATAALATVTLKDPRTLVLQKSDFPPGARLTRTIDSPRTPAGDGLALMYRYRGPSSLNQLTSSAFVFTSESQAIALYKHMRKDTEAFLEKLPKDAGYVPRLSLPRYGEEQLATYHPLDGGKLLVRTNTVVWSLLLQNLPGTGRLNLSKAEAAAELKKYGRKQQQRVGSG